MTDLETVIEAMEACSSDYGCKYCPYRYDEMCFKSMSVDALKILKNYEARLLNVNDTEQ